MPIYTTPLSQLKPEDLQELLDGKAVENIRLEFKLLPPKKDEILKKLSAFANTFGGFVVIGAKANSDDGRIEELPGVDEQPSYKQQIIQWCFDGASPPLTVEVSDPIPAPSGNGKFCYVISVAESEVAPHFLYGRKGVWIRTDEFSSKYDAHLADENELRHLLDRRKVTLERRASLVARSRQRFNTFIVRSQMNESAVGRRNASRLELSVTRRFPSKQACPQEELRTVIQGSRVRWREMMFPDSGKQILSQHESAIVLLAARKNSYFEANSWGMTFYGCEIESELDKERGIHVGQFVGLLLLFISHAGSILPTMNVAGPVELELRVNSLLETQWLIPMQGWLEPRAGSPLDDDLTVRVSTTVESVRDTPSRIVAELLRYTFFAVNWPELVKSNRDIESLIRLGFIYNSWQPPTSIDVEPI